MEEGEKWGVRQRKKFPDDDFFLRHIHTLRKYYEQTHPEHKEESEKNKTFIANQAISDAFFLFHYLCGWAEDHLQGIAYNYYKDGQLPINLNSHKNEFFSEQSKSHKYWNPPPEALRGAVSVILSNDPPSDSSINLNELSKALSALNDGEIHYILSRTKSKKRGSKGNKPTLEYLKWISICYVYIIRGFSMKAVAALEIISKELGITTSALSKWEKEIGKKFDPERIIRKEIQTYVSAANLKVKKSDKNHKMMTGYEVLKKWQEMENKSYQSDDDAIVIDFVLRLHKNHPLNKLKV